MIRSMSFVLLAVLATSTVAGTDAAERAKLTPQERAVGAQKYFTDIVLLNQDGQEMRFYSDLIEGKTVIIIPFFTTCTSVCPSMNRNLQKIQDWLGDRLGKDVVLLSISVDSETDTVPKLKEYADRYHARKGWYFLGGKKENVDFALKRIGQYVDSKESHSTIMILGNVRTGLWKKAMALGRFEDLIKVVDSVVNDDGQAASK